MIVLYSFIAVFIAWIWVDYYRLIDIYEQEKLKYLILTFFLGCASVLVVFGIQLYVLDSFYFELNGNFLNDFLYSVFKIGLVEEIAKTIPFLIMFFLFKKEFNEPIDFLAFMCVSALGFSAVENVLYFTEHGPNIINNRAILSTVGHMFDSSLVAYGIIRYKYYPKGNKVLSLILFFFLAALAHGFYDFWLLFEGTESGGWLMTILFFLITVSVFAIILNNALNNSSFFTYKKVIDSNMVLKRLLSYYGVVFAIQFILLIFHQNFEHAINNLVASILLTGFIILVTCIRLTRFKLIHKRWNDLKLEFPFFITKSDPTGMNASQLVIRMRGDSFNEVSINVFYEEYFILNPLSKRNTNMGTPRLAFIERKIFLYNDDTFYVVKVFDGNENSRYELMLIKAKTANVTMVNNKYPIVAVLKIENFADLDNVQMRAENFKFREWAFLKPT
ncbi:MAG: PrsW family glutamic-type intramembrane protease [Crocinitomicaceae bacterium]|nr:PrsW family glutamic-type intramembrane protease [Crocinitomicaceae bacterium]